MTEFWNDRPTFVTGGTGLVGGWLVHYLEQAGADLVCLVRDWVPRSELVTSGLAGRVKIVRGDVTDYACIERILGEYEIDTVFHLAAQTIVSIANRNPLSTFEANVRGTWTLLEACRRTPTVRQVVLASSDKAYGDQDGVPYTEDMPLCGRHPYDVSKSCADLIAQAYARTYDLPVTITRCGNFFGGADLNWNRLVPGTIRAVLRGRRPIIRSDGTFVRDYFYVEDGAAAYVLAAEALAASRELTGAAFNFSYGEEATVLDIVRRIMLLMDSDLEPDIRNEASNEIRCQRLDTRRAREVLDWKPQVGFEEGLKRTIRWYEKYFACPQEAATASGAREWWKE
jgi:CDP-glucose 4,6-dehydratase